MYLEVIDFYEIKYKEGDGYYLVRDNWNDYGYYTTYHLWIIEGGSKENFGVLNIADIRYDESDEQSLYRGINEEVLNNPEQKQYISLGSIEYYNNLLKLQTEDRVKLLKLLQDLAYELKLLEKYQHHSAVTNSFLRGKKVTDVKSRYHRLAKGNKHIKYDIEIKQKDNMKFKLKLNVDSNSIIPTNIHALIGNNGFGKTKTLQGMTSACEGQVKSSFNSGSKITKSEDGIFSASVNHLTDVPVESALESIIYISYSPFDNHRNIEKLTDNENVKFIGILDSDKKRNKSLNERMDDELYDLLNSEEDKLLKDKSIPANISNINMWNESIDNLKFDEGIRGLSEFLYIKQSENGNVSEISRQVIKKLSSGQKILLLSLASLISEAVERTLIIIDEPELFLHPPLITSYIRELSRILTKTDSICLVATHSPFIVQELPRECVHMLDKMGHEMIIKEPNTQTFGENIARINNNIFGTDMRQTGFYNFLSKLAKEAEEKSQILLENNELGIDAQVILRSHLDNKDDYLW